MKNDEYLFLFVGGSGGSFLKGIFFYYLYKLKKHNYPVIFKINPENGDCHKNNLPKHYHSIYDDDINLNKKIVVIDFDEDDRKIIAKMAVHKVVKHDLKKNPDLLQKSWDGKLSHIDPMNFNLVETALVEDPNLLIYPDWAEQMSKINPVLTVKFKDIMFGNLNEILANFFQTTALPEVDKIINEYRAVNKKYIDN